MRIAMDLAQLELVLGLFCCGDVSNLGHPYKMLRALRLLVTHVAVFARIILYSLKVLWHALNEQILLHGNIIMNMLFLYTVYFNSDIT